MKKLIVGLLALCQLSVHGMTIIQCDFSTQKGTGIEQMILKSGDPGIVEIHYVDRRRERLETKQRKGGIFGAMDFPVAMSDKNGLSYVESPRYGDVFIKFDCHMTPTIPFPRCVSQGSGEQALYAAVEVKMRKKVYQFKGNNICKRF